MSSPTQYQRFCASVLEEFRLFCDKGESPIDPGLIQGLITEYTETLHTREALPVSPPPVGKGKKTRRKKSEAAEDETCDFCRMPEPDHDKCMSRSFGNGFGTQCTRVRKVGEFCGMHSKKLSESGDPSLGRIDEPRRLKRADDETKAIGWKHFKDDGTGVEDITVGTVGVGPITELVRQEEEATPIVVAVVEEEDEDLEIPAICMGVYQGVPYRFVVKEGEEHRIVQKVDPLTCILMDVGYYDGDEIVFDEDYMVVHEMKITDEDQEEVIWA